MEQTLKKAISVILVVLTVFSVAAGIGGFDFGDIGIKANAATITSKNRGDIVEFGAYPQTLETDSSVIEALNNADCEWISYGYYSGTGDTSDGQMVSGDYMRYADVSYGADKYRGVVFDSYRPECTGETSSFTLQDNNDYYIGEVYWFKYEPIKWRVLDPAHGLVLSEVILDSQAYGNFIIKSGTDEYGYDGYWLSPEHCYANNYKASSIREWLNNDFFNMAFSSEEQRLVLYRDLENRAFSRSYSAFDSEPTSDKIFLLSYEEAMNADYGFASPNEADSSRCAYGSDYSKCQGLVVSGEKSFWSLRSTGYESYMMCVVENEGRICVNGFVGDTTIGIRPAMTIDIFAEIFESDASGSTTDTKNTTDESAPSTEYEPGSGTHGGFEYVTDEKGNAAIIGVKGSISGNLVIPSEIDGHPVTKIKAWAFGNGCDEKVTITIPDTVMEIDEDAFRVIDYSLTGIFVDENNKKYSSDEYGVLFNKDKTELILYPVANERKAYEVPDSVESIADYAFEYSGNLEELNIPSSVTNIEKYAFDFSGSFKRITVNADNEFYSTNEHGVLFNKDKTVLVKYPEGNEREAYDIPYGVQEIGYGAFYNSVNLKNITIPNSVSVIGERAFEDCFFLSEIVIPEGVQIIAFCAFDDCGLTSVSIPSSVTNIGESAFNGCDSLNAITVDKNNAVYSSNEYGVLFNKNKTELILYPIGNERTSYAIPDGVTRIEDYAFCFSANLETVEIPDSVTQIGIYAFAWSDKLTSIVIPEGVTEISDCTFGWCTSLETITIPESVTDIHGMAFEGCDSLADVYYGGSKSAWDEINIEYGNESLSDATIHFAEDESSDKNYQVGDRVKFGSYPQSEVKDYRLIKELNKLEVEWKSYNYYSGTGNWADGMMHSSDYMKYADVNYNGEKYRAVTFTEYRPGSTGGLTDANSSSQDDNGYKIDNVYWFKYEPIEWRILDPVSGYVMSELILDGQPFSNIVYYNGTSGYFNSISSVAAPGNFETSSIKEWLNGGFYSSAFSAKEEEAFLFLREPIFLLYKKDAQNTELGFAPQIYDPNLKTICTAYSRCQGLGAWPDGAANWYLCNGGQAACHAAIVSDAGYIYIYNSANDISGIRPVTKIDLSSEYVIPVDEETTLPESTTQPVPTTTQLVLTTTKPVSTTTQRVETTVTPSTVAPSTTKPVTEPTTAKPTEPSTTQPVSTTKPVTTKPAPVEDEIIKKPSTSTVKYGETLILHADFINIPEGTKIEWSVEGDGVTIVPSEDGKTCSVKSTSTGDVTVTAKYTDENGVEHISEQNIESKAGLWQKIVYFVKTIFGIPTVIPNAIKFIF